MPTVGWRLATPTAALWGWTGARCNLPAGQTASLSGNFSLALDNGAAFNNAGTFFAQTNTSIFNNNSSGGTFNNSGTFIRDTATGTLNIGPGIAFANSGTVNIATGTLSFGGGFTQSMSGAIMGAER